MKTLLLFLAVVGFTSFASAADWLTDYDDALRQAQRKNRPVMLYFTADYCGQCRNLERKALDKGRFHRYADDKLILFRTEETARRRQHPRLYRQNERLRNQFRVTAYPTMILVYPNGRYMADVPYKNGDATQLTKDIDRLLKSHKGRDNHRPHPHRGHRR